MMMMMMMPAANTYMSISLVYGFCQSLNTSESILVKAALRLNTYNSGDNRFLRLAILIPVHSCVLSAVTVKMMKEGMK